MLKKAGIVRSVRGAGGGYVLVKRLEDISVGDVLRALEVYAFIQGWNEYMFAMIFTTSDSLRTLPVAIGQMSKSYSVYWNELMAASCLSSVPLIVVFVFLQRYFISNMTGGAVKE